MRCGADTAGSMLWSPSAASEATKKTSVKPVVLQFLCNGLEEDFALKRHAAGNVSVSSELDMLVQSSGKMLLLHKLLPKLKAEGHKV